MYESIMFFNHLKTPLILKIAANINFERYTGI